MSDSASPSLAVDHVDQRLIHRCAVWTLSAVFAVGVGIGTIGSIAAHSERSAGRMVSGKQGGKGYLALVVEASVLRRDPTAPWF